MNTKALTTEELQQILGCIIHRVHGIKTLANNPEVSQDHKDSMAQEMIVMNQIREKLFPSLSSEFFAP